MKCPRCQHENPAGMKFCGLCAAPLASTCPSCGAVNPPENKFCGQCAAPFRTSPTTKFATPDSYTPKHLAEKILTSKAALEGERKQVTVLFADLKGSMELLADRDPEEARKLLDPVLQLMMEAVHRYEGTVNQVMGDGIMALFGAPLAHEDHAVRACYAALRMQDGVQALFGGRCAALTASRSRSASASTPARSWCARSAAISAWTTRPLARRRTWRPAWSNSRRPARMRLTAETLRLAEGYVEVKSLGPIPVKGLADPVEIFELTGAGHGAHAPAGRGAPGSHTLRRPRRRGRAPAPGAQSGRRRATVRWSPSWARPAWASRDSFTSSPTRITCTTG